MLPAFIIHFHEPHSKCSIGPVAMYWGGGGGGGWTHPWIINFPFLRKIADPHLDLHAPGKKSLVRGAREPIMHLQNLLHQGRHIPIMGSVMEPNYGKCYGALNHEDYIYIGVDS